jgi:hypothetical protein
MREVPGSSPGAPMLFLKYGDRARSELESLLVDCLLALLVDCLFTI